MTSAQNHLERETATQPGDWRAVAGRAAEFSHLLPQPGESVAIVGCGTSWHVALAYAAVREAAGQGTTDAWPASEYHPRSYDRVILLSRSGTTTEVVALVDPLLAAGTKITAIVATPGTPLTDRVSDVILLSEVDEQSVVQTRFATTALALLRTSVGDDVLTAADQAQASLDEPEETALGLLLDTEQISFLGSGMGYGIAVEAALKLRESCQFWTEAYHTMEYRHGPIAIAAPGRTVWAFGPLPDGMAEQIAATGARLEHRDLDPMAELVRVHRYCAALARRLGLNADSPRNLTRSVILA